MVGCQDGGVILAVWVAAWQREEDLRVVTVGDEVSFWLTFDEAERGAAPAEGIQVIQGLPGC